MGRRKQELTSEEERAQRLISATQIMAGLQKTNQIGIANIPPKLQAGAPDPLNPGQKLPRPYRYYRVHDPQSPEGARTIELLRLYGYEPATDGESFPTMPGGAIFRCHPLQHDQANLAMKKIAVQQTSEAGERERRRVQEAARYAFGSADVTAEVTRETLDPRNL